MSDNYARLTSAPRRATLGGETVYVGKLTPRGLGEIQAFFADSLESPYERARREIADLPDDEARSIWTAAVLEAKQSWPPGLNSEISLELLSTIAGRATLIWVATHKHTEHMTRKRADDLAVSATIEEIGNLLSMLMPGEIGDYRTPDADGDGVPYAEVRHMMISDFKWTLDQVDDLTFEAIRLIATEGKSDKGVSIDDESQALEAAKRWREYYVGL